MARILIACEESGSMRRAFASLGHDVDSCDLQASIVKPSPAHYGKEAHYQGDIFDLLPQSAGSIRRKGKYDLIVGFPPCTFLSKAQIWMCNKDYLRAKKRDLAVDFVKKLILSGGQTPMAIENPPGYLSSALRPYDQIIRPYQFGDLYHKEICLWLFNGLPSIAVPRSEDKSAADRLKSKSVNNHTNGRMSQYERAVIRSSWGHFPNMCMEIAKQWSDFIENKNL